MAILFVTQHYWPEPIGSAPYITDIAEHLALFDEFAQVFTCRPHYPQGEVDKAYRSGDRDKENRNRVKITRVAPFKPQHHGVTGRLARETAFLFQGLLALFTGRLRRQAAVVSLCPSVFTVLVGIVARKPHGRHVVLVHDIQSGLAQGLGMTGSAVLTRLMQWVETFAFNRADVIVVLSTDMRKRLRNQGVRTPIEVVPIWVDTKLIKPARAPRGLPVTVVYSGNLGKKQGLDQLLEMAEHLEFRDAAVEIILRGEGSERARLKRIVAEKDLSCVRFEPLAPVEKLGASLAEGAIHIVPQDPNAADCAVPSKTYTIMASGRPFIATAHPDSQLWTLQERSEGFICVTPGDPETLANAVQHLAAHPRLRACLGRNGRRYALRNHNKSLLLDRFAAITRTPPSEATWKPHPSHIS